MFDENILIDFFKYEGLYDEKTFSYIDSIKKIIPNKLSDMNLEGCFPIINKDGILTSFSINVPKIDSAHTMIKNIRLYYQAIIFTNNLNKIFKVKQCDLIICENLVNDYIALMSNADLNNKIKTF